MAIRKSLLLSAALVLLFCAAHISAHSWLDCADYRDDGRTFVNSAVKTNCDGFQRGYTSREVNPDGSLYKITSLNPSLPACRRDVKAYTSQFPMSTARPGETLTMMWTPNGHTEWHKPKPPPNGPRDVYLKWSGVPNKDLNTMGDVRKAKDFIPPVQFDTPCHNRKTCAQLDSSGGLCTWDYTLPANLPAGRYQFVWWWPFNFAGDSVTEEYVSCFDVMVSGTPMTPLPDTSKCAVGGIGKYNGSSSAPTPTPTPTPTPPSTGNSISLNPIEDSYVRADQANTNFGSATSLTAQKFATNSQGTKEIFLKFDAGAQIGSKYIKSATLSLTPRNSPALDLRVQSVSSAWSENSINYNNKPSPSYFAGLFNKQNSVTLNPGALQVQQKNNNGFITLRIFKEDPSSNVYNILSRESDSQPTLKIELSSTPVDYILEGDSAEPVAEEAEASTATMTTGNVAVALSALVAFVAARQF